jgi:hypothetical protein
VDCQFLLDLGQDLITRKIFSPPIGQRDGSTQLAVDTIPVAGLEWNGIDPQRLTQPTGGDGTKNVFHEALEEG